MKKAYWTKKIVLISDDHTQEWFDWQCDSDSKKSDECDKDSVKKAQEPVGEL